MEPVRDRRRDIEMQWFRVVAGIVLVGLLVMIYAYLIPAAVRL